MRHTVDTTTYSDNTRKHNIVNNVISRPVDNTTFSDNIELDRDNLLTDDTRKQFRNLHRRFDSVFDPTIVGCKGHVGPFTATVNMGPVVPPQRKGRCPQYARDKLVELQDKFGELEAQWRIVGSRGPGARTSVGPSAMVRPNVYQLKPPGGVRSGAEPRRQTHFGNNILKIG